MYFIYKNVLLFHYKYPPIIQPGFNFIDHVFAFGSVTFKFSGVEALDKVRFIFYEFSELVIKVI
jgi:hypothetical protein